MRKRAAIIDLGTNTFNLLILDIEGSNHQRIFSRKVGVALGLGGINDGQITFEAKARAINTLTAFKDKCDEMQVEEIHCFGTSAVRSARNKDEFLKMVKDDVGLTIQVVSGDKEAELIYLGVSSGYTFDESGMIMDIGGGSTEFIWSNAEGMVKSRSFEIGVSRIFQLFDFSDPYSQEDIQKIEFYLKEQTTDFFEDVSTNILIGASGSFETFYELVHQKPFPDKVYVELNRAEIMLALEKIITSTQKERDVNEFIIPIRKKMAPISAIKIRWIIRKLDVSKIVISPFSLKEGVIQSII